MEKNQKNIIKPVRTGEKQAFQGKWLQMKYVDFDNNGKQCKNYEVVERTTRKPGVNFDGVDILPIITKKNCKKQLLLIACYRPPLDQYVLEFPAGLMDDSDLCANALRELKEETGYTGVISKDQDVKNLTILHCDPWKSTECGKIIKVDIDGDLPENINPKQELENTENILTFCFDMDEKLQENLENKMQENNFAIDSKLYTFAQGISFAKKFL